MIGRGTGRDKVFADAMDVMAADCEEVDLLDAGTASRRAVAKLLDAADLAPVRLFADTVFPAFVAQGAPDPTDRHRLGSAITLVARPSRPRRGGGAYGMLPDAWAGLGGIGWIGGAPCSGR